MPAVRDHRTAWRQAWEPFGERRVIRPVIANSETKMAQTATREKTAEHQSKRTREPQAIRRWAEPRGGHPAVVEGTEILRIDFDEPEDEHEKLSRISWEDFFRIFNSRDLEFLYQERTQDGKPSRFNKFVRSGNEDDR
jgi:hypothetical protein